MARSLPDAERVRREGRFVVVGPVAVFGSEPGTTVVLSLTDGEAQALIDAGHIAPAKQTKKTTASKGEAGSKGDS